MSTGGPPIEGKPKALPDTMPLLASLSAFTPRQCSGPAACYLRGQLWGGSPGFFDMINGLIAEDGDIEPVLTGTINIGATLLQLSAMATNTTPEWILASLNEGDDEAQA